MDAAWHVDRHDRGAAGIGHLYHRAHRAFEIASKPGPEQPVNDNAAAIDQIRRQGVHLAVPTASHQRGIAFEPRHLAHQAEPHWPAGGLEMACHNEAVAAIVTRPPQHERRPRRPPHA